MVGWLVEAVQSHGDTSGRAEGMAAMAGATDGDRQKDPQTEEEEEEEGEGC